MQLPLLSRRTAPLAVMLLTAAGAGWSASPPTSGIVEYETQVIPVQGQAQKTSMKMWFKGPRIRQETSTPGGKAVALVNAEGMFVLMPGSNQAMRTAIKGHLPGGAPGMLGQLEHIKKQGKKVGSERVGRYQADIYEQVSSINQPGLQGRFTTRSSIAPGVPVPVKIVTKSANFSSITTLKSVQMNSSIPDSMFELPKGTKIITRPPTGAGFGARPSPH